MVNQHIIASVVVTSYCQKTSSVDSVPSVVSVFDYSNNTLGQRIRRADYFDASTMNNGFIYNILGEVISALMNDDNYTYNNDPIGNRVHSIVDSGQSSVTNRYTSNNLNQYTSVSSVSSVVNPVYDPDGSLTFNGDNWHHSWNGENRLICSSNENSGVVCTYAYDYQGRRISKTTLTPDPFSSLTFIYIWDGFNIAAEIFIDHVTPATNISYYSWGIDLSGTLQGAGGVGGLLCETKVATSSTNTYYALSDANGNITEYADENGTVKAHGKHSAFGETELSGTMKDDFTHWFSSKPFDPKTRLAQYPYRPYDGPTGRWLSRDPIEERSGNNLYLLGNNDAVNSWDKLGLFSVRPVAGSPRVKANTDGTFGGLWASVVILPDNSKKPLTGIVLHMKHTEIHVSDCETGKPITDSTQTVQKRILTSGRSGWPLESGLIAPIYSNVAELRGYGKCVKGNIIVKAVWYHFADSTGLPPAGDPITDDLSGSMDNHPAHGHILSTSGWPSITAGSYLDFGSLSIEIKLTCGSPFYEVKAAGRGLDSGIWERRRGRRNDEEGSEPYYDWYN